MSTLTQFEEEAREKFLYTMRLLNQARDNGDLEEYVVNGAKLFNLFRVALKEQREVIIRRINEMAQEKDAKWGCLLIKDVIELLKS